MEKEKRGPINFAPRVRNKQWLTSFLICVVAFAYQLLGLFEIVPSVSQDLIVQLISLGVNIAMGLGIVIDPTTEGIADSDRAMTYTKPYSSKDNTIPNEFIR